MHRHRDRLLVCNGDISVKAESFDNESKKLGLKSTIGENAY